MTEMTETTKTEQKLCMMGRKTPNPCPFPATEPLQRLSFGDDEARLCAYHAATEPLVDESNEFGVSLELVRVYLKGARRQPCAGPLVAVLERAEADFSERVGIVDKVLEDLKAAEYKLMRG